MPEVGPGGFVTLMVSAVAVVVIQGGGADDYMRHIPRCLCLGFLPLHASLGAVAAGGRLEGGNSRRRRGRRCTPLVLGWGMGVYWRQRCLVGWRRQVWSPLLLRCLLRRRTCLSSRIYEC